MNIYIIIYCSLDETMLHVLLSHDALDLIIHWILHHISEMKMTQSTVTGPHVARISIWGYTS